MGTNGVRVSKLLACTQHQESNLFWIYDTTFVFQPPPLARFLASVRTFWRVHKSIFVTITIIHPSNDVYEGFFCFLVLFLRGPKIEKQSIKNEEFWRSHSVEPHKFSRKIRWNELPNRFLPGHEWKAKPQFDFSCFYSGVMLSRMMRRWLCMIEWVIYGLCGN